MTSTATASAISATGPLKRRESDNRQSGKGASFAKSASQNGINKRIKLEDPGEQTSSVVVVETETSSTTTVASAAAPSPGAISPPQETSTTQKATHFRHLRQKYLDELEYMLREFQKLERQLRGAAASAESTGSRERREKLHSFIQHLEETIQQIVTGVELEDAGQRTRSSNASQSQEVADSGKADGDLASEKEQEENVQRLEEHILANLLPVQVRLKKQLAAQQGAKHNPAGMPPVRGGALAHSTASQGKATFQKAAPPPPVHRESPLTSVRPAPTTQTQFGKPLDGGGSSLTQKLHGETLGLHSRSKGSGVGQPSEAFSVSETNAEASCGISKERGSLDSSTSTTKKILYAGMALGSNQIKSSISAANSVHKMVIRNPDLLEIHSEAHADLNGSANLTPTSIDSGAVYHQDNNSNQLKLRSVGPVGYTSTGHVPLVDDDDRMVLSQSAKAAILSYEERRKLRKKRRRKRKRRLQEQQASAAAAAAARQSSTTTSTIVKRKTRTAVAPRGPRNVEYMCALCNEIYSSTCDCNPWWALAQHECPKCHKVQIPRVDISAPANAIEYHPALLAHADDGAAAAIAAAPAPEAIVVPPAAAPTIGGSDDDLDDEESDISDDDWLMSDDDFDDDDYSSDGDSCDTEFLNSLSPAEQAEHERFGAEYQGPKLSDEKSAALLTLMLHATTCPCQHKDEINREVCRSTKWMMLHVRDCPGTTASFDVCPFPWCRKVKHLLYHLVSCTEPEQCRICNGSTLPKSMRRLHYLNANRGKKYNVALVEKSRNEAEKSLISQLVEHSNGAGAEDPELVAAGGEEPTPIGTGHSHPDLTAIAGSSNSLAALAAAADVLAAEDFDAHLDSAPDEALVSAASISIFASGADTMVTENPTFTNSCNTNLEEAASEAEVVPSQSACDSGIQDGMAVTIEGVDATLASGVDAKVEGKAEMVSSLSASDAASQNEASVKMQNGDTSVQSDVDTKPTLLEASLKMKDEILTSNLSVTVAGQSLELLSPRESSTAVVDTEEAEKKSFDSSEQSIPPIHYVDNAASVVESSQPESEPLRVQETIG